MLDNTENAGDECKAIINYKFDKHFDDKKYLGSLHYIHLISYESQTPA